MFRNQMFSYVVLLTGEYDTMQRKTKNCVETLQKIMEKDECGLEWIVCASEPVERLSQLPDCYEKGMQIFAYRYFGYSHVISSDMVLGNNTEENELKDLVAVDTNVVNPTIFQNFLCNALEDETDSFVKNYIQMVGESALKSKMFRQYILLNIHFCIVSFLQKLGYEKDVIDNSLLEASGMNQVADLSVIEESIKKALHQFSTDFWSVGTFGRQEGAMGQLIQKDHPLFKEFPTESHTNWQWWPMANQRTVILPDTVKQPFDAIITEMDSYAFLRPMAQLFECRVGNGKLLYSTLGLQDLQQYPEGKALLRSIYKYLDLEIFAPKQSIEWETLVSI